MVRTRRTVADIASARLLMPALPRTFLTLLTYVMSGTRRCRWLRRRRTAGLRKAFLYHFFTFSAFGRRARLPILFKRILRGRTSIEFSHRLSPTSTRSARDDKPQHKRFWRHSNGIHLLPWARAIHMPRIAFANTIGRGTNWQNCRAARDWRTCDEPHKPAADFASLFTAGLADGRWRDIIPARPSPACYHFLPL